MSHQATIKTQIKSVEALRKALADLGLALGPAGQVRWYSGTMPADYVVKMPGAYDLGFKQEADGTLSFVSDTEVMGGSYYRGQDARNLLGPNASKLMEKYVDHYLPELAGGQYMVQKTEENDEFVEYDLTSYN